MTCSSYLDNRIQYVSYNTTYSDCMKITCGVPQGSILSSLHVLYINVIENVLDILNPMSADDTNLFHDHTNFDTLIEEVNIKSQHGSIPNYQ